MKHSTRTVIRAVLCAVLVANVACDAGPKPNEEAGSAAEQGPAVAVPEAAWDAERVYLRWRDRFAEDPNLAKATGEAWTKMDLELKRVANESGPAHLRANAALLLGAIHEERGERRIAIAHYRQASKLVTDDAGPQMALALALAAEKEFVEAAEVQLKATELDPDNLENWLALAELRIKAGDNKAGAEAYVAYERRRKGLIDGLTLRRKDGAYLLPVDERVACAEALASASDEGTAIAMMYALKSDDDAQVREAVARMMGLQRFSVYAAGLEAQLASEVDESVKTAVAWAMTEIARDPVAPSQAIAPTAPEDAVAPEGAAPTEPTKAVEPSAPESPESPEPPVPEPAKPTP